MGVVGLLSRPYRPDEVGYQVSPESLKIASTALLSVAPPRFGGQQTKVRRSASSGAHHRPQRFVKALGL